jgi:hypothetical protein
MHKIYHNSSVTLAALSPSNPHQPMLRRRRTEMLAECRWPGRSDGEYVMFGLPETPFRAEPRSTGSSNRFVHGSDSPLLERGWVVQEQLLSRRVVYFGHDEVHFECREKVYRESDWELFIDREGRPGGRVWGNLGLSSHICDVWDTVVHMYTERSLTMATDKLPALAGLARRHCDDTGDDYKAGLFVSSLLWQLQWLGRRDSDAIDDDCSSTRYIAPTWSWASYDGPVRFNSHYIEGEKGPMAEVVEVVTVPESEENPFGRLLSGHLILRARIQSLRLVRRRTFGSEWSWDMGKLADAASLSAQRLDGRSSSHAGCQLDVDILPRECGSECVVECVLLWIRTSFQGLMYAWYGIALKRVASKPLPVYERIGAVGGAVRDETSPVDFDEFWGDVAEQEIKLV